MGRLAAEAGLRLVTPPPALCTDNGAMIAWAGIERLALGLSDKLDVSPRARWSLEDVSHPPAGRPTGPSAHIRHPADRR